MNTDEITPRKMQAIDLHIKSIAATEAGKLAFLMVIVICALCYALDRTLNKIAVLEQKVSQLEARP